MMKENKKAERKEEKMDLHWVFPKVVKWEFPLAGWKVDLMVWLSVFQMAGCWVVSSAAGLVAL